MRKDTLSVKGIFTQLI